MVIPKNKYDTLLQRVILQMLLKRYVLIFKNELNTFYRNYIKHKRNGQEILITKQLGKKGHRMLTV